MDSFRKVLNGQDIQTKEWLDSLSEDERETYRSSGTRIVYGFEVAGPGGVDSYSGGISLLDVPKDKRQPWMVGIPALVDGLTNDFKRRIVEAIKELNPSGDPWTESAIATANAVDSAEDAATHPVPVGSMPVSTGDQEARDEIESHL